MHPTAGARVASPGCGTKRRGAPREPIASTSRARRRLDGERPPRRRRLPHLGR
jgi:hypothetical protein